MHNDKTERGALLSLQSFQLSRWSDYGDTKRYMALNPERLSLVQQVHCLSPIIVWG